MDSVVTISDRLYRLILNAYPRSFRDEYGEEMAQILRDQVREAWTRDGAVGVTRLWLSLLVDSARSAFAEHRLNGSFGRRGLRSGLAMAIGYPLAFVSFIAWSGELVGFETAENWLLHRPHLYPILAGPGFILVGVGLHGLYRRLQVPDSPAIQVVRAGVGLGLAGMAGIILGLSGSPDFFAGFSIPAAFVLLTIGLAAMGGIAIRRRTFGAFSFAPLAASGSAVVWFLSLPRQLSGGIHSAFQTSSTLAHITMWVILGVVVWAYPAEHAPTVAMDHEVRPGDLPARWTPGFLDGGYEDD